MFDSPVIELVNTPEPLPSVVLELPVVGFDDVLQHTPRAVTFAPPLSVMFPPLVAELVVISIISSVVKTGIEFTIVSVFLVQRIANTSNKLKIIN